MRSRKSERGQAMIFIVLGFIVILGFVGLAIDGGMYYSDRRNAQNAADASSLAAGGKAALVLENEHVFYGQWNCSDTRIAKSIEASRKAAVNRAASNQFTLSEFASSVDVATITNGVVAVCGVDNSKGWADKYIDITVVIEHTTNTTFTSFLVKEPLKSKVYATTRVRPRAPLAYGHAVVALNDAACQGNQNGVIVSGSSDTHIKGGGIFSNGCLSGNGSSFKAQVENGNIAYVGAAEGSMGGFSPAPTKMPMKLPPDSYAVKVPNCSHPDAKHLSDITLHNGSLTLDPGLYCIGSAGDAANKKSISINGGTFKAEGVTLYVLGGSVDISGNADTTLAAPGATPNPNPAIPGLLLYMAPGTGSVSMQGNNSSSYLGTIYAPNNNVTMTGANDTTPTFNTQVIGFNVEISGNAKIDINFNEAMDYQRPSAMELYK